MHNASNVVPCIEFRDFGAFPVFWIRAGYDYFDDDLVLACLRDGRIDDFAFWTFGDNDFFHFVDCDSVAEAYLVHRKVLKIQLLRDGDVS